MDDTSTIIVIAVAISGISTSNMKVSAYHLLKGQENYINLNKARDII